MHSTLDDPHIVYCKVFSDVRGSFREVLNLTEFPFNSESVKYRFIQQNISVSKKNAFRGLHYQLKNPQGKLVTVLNGAVTDYIIDLREWSPTFKKVSKYFLTADDPKSATLWVPPGFAHGFHSLMNNTVFCYNVFHNPWVQGDEYSIDPYSVEMIRNSLKDTEIILSDKDKASLQIGEAPFYTK